MHSMRCCSGSYDVGAKTYSPDIVVIWASFVGFRKRGEAGLRKQAFASEMCFNSGLLGSLFVCWARYPRLKFSGILQFLNSLCGRQGLCLFGEFMGCMNLMNLER